jgi:hypothetical protein
MQSRRLSGVHNGAAATRAFAQAAYSDCADSSARLAALRAAIPRSDAAMMWQR